MDNGIISQNTSVMDYTKSILPMLWEFLDSHGDGSLSLNISVVNHELVVSVFKNSQHRRFREDDGNFMRRLQNFLQA